MFRDFVNFGRKVTKSTIVDDTLYPKNIHTIYIIGTQNICSPQYIIIYRGGYTVDHMRYTVGTESIYCVESNIYRGGHDCCPRYIQILFPTVYPHGI